MFKNLSPAGFFGVVMIYFIAMFIITLWSSTYDIGVGNIDQQQLFYMKVVQVITVLLFFVAPACLFVLFFSPEKLHYFSLNKLPSFLFVIVSCVLVITALPFIAYLEEFNKSMSFPKVFSGVENWMIASEAKVKQIEEAFIKDQSTYDLLVNLFVIALVAAFWEELFFRGLLQRSMYNFSKNSHLSIWVTAILFSAFHMQFYGFIPRVFLGAILGYLYSWSGSLWSSIIVHFLNNALVLVLSFLLSTSILSKEVEAFVMDGDKVIPLWVLVSLGSMVLCLFLLNKLKKPIHAMS